jgi:hypothetical protein
MVLIRKQRPRLGAISTSYETSISKPFRSQQQAPSARLIRAAMRPVAKEGAEMIRASNWRPLQRNTLPGFMDLELPSGLIIRDCLLHRRHGKDWIGLPPKPMLDKSQALVKDATGRIVYVPLVEIKDKAARERFQAGALDAANALIGDAP